MYVFLIQLRRLLIIKTPCNFCFCTANVLMCQFFIKLKIYKLYINMSEFLLLFSFSVCTVYFNASFFIWYWRRVDANPNECLLVVWKIDAANENAMLLLVYYTLYFFLFLEMQMSIKYLLHDMVVHIERFISSNY